MKYKVASTENDKEYGFNGFASLVPVDKCVEASTLDVNPKAGLSKARTLEPVSSAKGFIARLHEYTEAPKPCNKIIGRPSFQELLWATWERVWLWDELFACDSASYTLWCICTPLNSQKQLSGSAKSEGSNNSSWSIPAIFSLFCFVLASSHCSGDLKPKKIKINKTLTSHKLAEQDLKNKSEVMMSTKVRNRNYMVLELVTRILGTTRATDCSMWR